MALGSSSGALGAPLLRGAGGSAIVLLARIGQPGAPQSNRTAFAAAPDAREQRERDNRRDENAEAVALPSTADVINDAERNVEQGSRAAGRLHARDQASQQLREARDSFHQAMKEAGRKQAGGQQPAAGQPRATDSKPESKAQAGGSRDSQPAEKGGGDSRQPTTAQTATDKPAAQPAQAAPTPAAPRAAAQAVAPLQPTPAAPSAAAAAQAKAGGVQALEAAGATSPTAARGSAAKPGGPASPVQPARGSARLTAARARAAAKPQPAKSAEQAKRIEQLVRVLKRELGAGKTRIVMRLTPPELGKLRMEANLKGDALTLRVQTETHVAHELLKHDAETLRHALELAGIRLEHMDVRPPDPTDRTGADMPQPEPDGHHAERDPSSDADTDRPPPDGTDSSFFADAPERASRDSSQELVLDARVNILA